MKLGNWVHHTRYIRKTGKRHDNLFPNCGAIMEMADGITETTKEEE